MGTSNYLFLLRAGSLWSPEREVLRGSGSSDTLQNSHASSRSPLDWSVKRNEPGMREPFETYEERSAMQLRLNAGQQAQAHENII